MSRAVFFVSCSTGITAETLGHSLLTQFDNVNFDHITMPFVNSVEKGERVLKMINRTADEGGQKPLVFSTLTNPDVRRIVSTSNAVFFDLFDAFIQPLEDELEMESSHAVGRFHGMANYERYMSRIDAVNFALLNDDGVTTKNYGQADIILAGVSRAGKTPTCLYLAMQYGVRAANYPLTEEDLEDPHLPEELAPYREKLYGLTIEPRRLQEIRSERRPDSRYSSAIQCDYETRKAEAMFKEYGVPFINTTTTSIEEISTTILHEAGIERRIY